MQLTKHWAAQLDDYVIDLAWSGDGSALAAASASGPVSLFGAADGSRRDLPGHDGGTNALAWAPPSRAGASNLLASGGQDGTVRIWDGPAGEHVAAASLGPAWVEHLRWGETLVAAAGRKLSALNPDGSVRSAFPDSPKTISALALGPAGSRIADGHFGGVRILDLETGAVAKEFPYGNGIHALAWSPDGKWLVSGNQDPSVHLWIPAEDAELHMSGYEGKVKHLSFDRTSRWLATSGGREACVWDCSGPGPEGREPSMLPHDTPVTAVAFQHDHDILATASQDGAVQFWSPERQQPLRATLRMPGAPTKIAWSSDDGLLAIGSEEGAVYVLRWAD